MQSPLLALPLIAAAQSQKHVTVNEALGVLDTLVQLAVLDRNLATPPAGPEEGDRFIVAASAAGAWAGHVGEIAAWRDGQWRFSVPRTGWLAYVVDEGALVAWSGAVWVDAISALTSLNNMVLLGVGTTADAASPFAAKLNKALWTARTLAEGGDGDLRYTLNKETSADVLSLLMQTGFSARAEFGLVGDDDLRLKMSADGSVFRQAMRVFGASGRIDFKDAQRQSCMYWTPVGNGTTVHLQGFGDTVTGTATARSVTTAGLFTQQRRVGFVTSSTAGTSAGTRHAALQFWRGNSAEFGGFYYCARFGISAPLAQTRAFVGLYASAGVIASGNPSALLSMVGLAFDSGQTTWRIMTNDSAGAATVIDLGANFPANTASTDLYELQVWCDPNGASIFYRVERLGAGDVAQGELTTDLPASSQLLSPQIWINNGSTSASTAIDVLSQYLETGF